MSESTKSALLVIDVQNDVMSTSIKRDEVVATIAGLVDRARAEDTPVVWVQHSNTGMVRDTEPWQIVEPLVPAAGEPIVHKRYGDSFEETDLADVLERLGAQRVVVTGAQTDACIRTTLHGALARGYDTTLVSDAHTTEDMREWGAPIGPEESIAYANMYWGFTTAPGRTTEVVPAADVSW